MRILYLTESMQWSGGAEQLLLMAVALRQRGHDLVLGCQPGSEIMARAAAQGIPTEPVRMRQDYDVPASLTVAQLLKKLKSDVLHAQHSTAHAIGLMAAVWTKVPVFAVTRRVIFPIKKNIFSWLKYRSSRINGYVAISGAVKGELLKAGIPPAQIEVIPSVMNSLTAPRDEGLALRRELGLPVDRPLIGTVANYAEIKGHEYLIEAAAEVVKRYPQAHFLIAGRDTEKLQPKVDRLGLTGSVLLVGFRRDVPRILAALNIFVLPSLMEAAGTALREAMAVGLPSIGTRVGGIPDSISHEETGLLVPPANASELASAIQRYLEKPEWAKAMGDRGQLWVKKQFSLEHAAQQMEAFYQRLLAGVSSS